MTDFTQIIEPVARLLLGAPNAALSSAHELRFGARGSLSVDLRKGIWHDYEIAGGGGVLDLITRATGAQGKARFEWLNEHGFSVDEAPGHTNGSGRGRNLGDIVATYDYVDELGTPLFQVVRFDPKDFRQRRPAKAGEQHRDGWVWSIKGCRQVPYRLPDLIEAIAAEKTVFVVEGEKDVNRLWDIGVPATCNAGGAGKWRPELSECFTGADVVIIPDNDPQKKHFKTGELILHPDGRPVLPGQDHARDVAKALDGVAQRVRVLDLKQFWPGMPPKGDVYDWLKDGGGSPQALFDLIERISDWTPGQEIAPPVLQLTIINLRAWHGVPARARGWVVPERIPEHNVTLATGQGGVGKTLLMQQLSVATVLGRDWIGLMPDGDPAPVLFITAEDDEAELHYRYEAIAKHYGTTFNELADAGLHVVSLAGKDATMAIADARGIVKPTALFEAVVRAAQQIRPRWIGLDTAADIFVVNERDRSEVRQCISLLRGLALDIDTAVILLAHPSLSGIASGSGLSGSTAWNNSVRSRLYLKVDKKKTDEEADDEEADDPGAVRILETMKSNYAGIGAPIRLVWRNGLLLPEAAIKLAPLDRVALDDRARQIFLALLARYNRQNLTVTRRERANNFAPTEFAKQDEARDLHKSPAQRKRLMREAMDYLLAKERIQVGWGPLGVPRSKQNECLYTGGTLL